MTSNNTTPLAGGTPTPKLKTWKVDAGNSGTGPCGFVVYDLKAATKEEALEKLKHSFALPEGIEGDGEDDDGNRTKILAYFNANFITLDNIEEDDDSEDEDGTSGQNRESYDDVQDRESYTTDGTDGE